MGAAHAFKALSNEATKKMYDEYCKNPERFIDNEIAKKLSNRDSFEKVYSEELRDFNSAGVVAANQGIPLSKMDKHTYQVYGESIQVSKEQRDACKKTIKQLVCRL